MQVDHAQTYLLGQLAVNALRNLVNFQSPEEFPHHYPDRDRELADDFCFGFINPCEVGVNRPEVEKANSLLRGKK